MTFLFHTQTGSMNQSNILTWQWFICM